MVKKFEKFLKSRGMELNAEKTKYMREKKIKRKKKKSRDCKEIQLLGKHTTKKWKRTTYEKPKEKSYDRTKKSVKYRRNKFKRKMGEKNVPLRCTCKKCSDV